MEFEFTTGAFCGAADIVDVDIVDDSVVEFMVVVEIMFAVVVAVEVGAEVVVEDVVYVIDEEAVALGLALQTTAEFNIITTITAMMAILLGDM